MHKKDKVNKYQPYLNHQYHSTHLFDMLILKTSLMKKIRTKDLALEINEISIENDNNDKESDHDNIMVTQPGDPTNKSKPAYTKKIILIVIKTIMVFQIVIKNNVMMNTKNIKIRDQELLNNLLNNTSVVNQATLKKTEMKVNRIILLKIMTVTDITKTTPTIMTDIEIMTDTEAIVEIIQKTIIDLILDKDTTIDLKAHTHIDPNMTTIDMKNSRYEELYPNLHIDHHTEITPIIIIILDQDIDHVLNHKEIPLDDIITRIDLHPDQEITDHDLEHLHRKNFPSLPYTAENQQFIKKFNFEFSDLIDTEYVNLCNILVNNQKSYDKHKNDPPKYQFITEID